MRLLHSRVAILPNLVDRLNFSVLIPLAMHFSAFLSLWTFALLFVAPWAAGADQLTAVTITHSRPVGADCLAKLLGVEERSLASRVEQVKAGAVVGSTAQEQASALKKMAALPSMGPGERVVAAMNLTEESPTELVSVSIQA